MEYNFREIEQKWQQFWKENNAYKVSNESSKPKYYVLDMFPYPSGAGLHVGHPLGYIASDIYSRYKRLKGFNVLHPMGYDAFGLPAEQYAIEHGVQPAVSTIQNINNFRSQLDKIGFSYDWDREVKTCEPGYYKWTQWIFLQLFKSFYNRQTQKAEPITTLEDLFEQEGNASHPEPNAQFARATFSAADWKGFSEKQQQDILMEYRLAFCGFGEVNWCEALGTVLANDEVVNGVSERGGHPVVKKKLRQWYLRITEYADRLLSGLNTIEFSDSMKEMQANWIGKSYGAEIEFGLTSIPLHSSNKPEPTSGHHFQMAEKSDWGLLKENSSENRKQQTDAEEIIWQELRNNKLGAKARRQQVIGTYIVDFAFMQQHLLVEIDGGYHDTEEQQTFDAARTSFLNELGYKLIRFSNQEVQTDLPAVLQKIKQHLNEAPPLREERRPGGEAVLKVYTTRPDTIFGVDFMVIAPEHELVPQITTAEQKQAVDEYIAYVKSRSERERQAEKKISGCFTGAYAVNPFNGNEIPVWISEYVLAGYGTGAIMAVPCGDERDFKFANHFGIPITNIIGDAFNGQEANPTKEAILHNSDFLNGMVMKDAIAVVNDRLEELGIGKKKVNYKMRDAAFSRQRYWGEPFPIVWKDGIAYPLDESELPLELPVVESYSPGPEGEGPLANIPEWTARHLETNTMPGYAGSSWYFLRYMDPQNNQAFCDRKASDYWNQVDLYIGGTEHAVGHLLYSRLWTKVLFDLGYIGFDEPFKKLLNQGMIQGSSRFVYRITLPDNTNEFYENMLSEGASINTKRSCFISRKFYLSMEDMRPLEKLQFLERFLPGIESQTSIITSVMHVPVHMVDGLELNIKAFKEWHNGEYANASFILEDGTFIEPGAPLSAKGEGPGVKYICGSEVEKMSKSKFNTVNPNDLVEKYGADTFRMYEMFLGPVEQSKPWDTKGIEGVHRFLKKLWRLFFDENKGLIATDEQPNGAELKVLHKTIKKIEEDTERYSFNTAVSTFMIAVNELSDLKCHKREILEAITIMLTPYAPHIAEELFHALGNNTSVLDASFPAFNAAHVTESSKEYPVSINGRLRTTMQVALDAEQADVEQMVMTNELVQKWMEGKPLKKFIFVKGKMINVVV